MRRLFYYFTRTFLVYILNKPEIKDSYRVKSVMPQFACHIACYLIVSGMKAFVLGEAEPPPRMESVFPQTKHLLSHKPFN